MVLLGTPILCNVCPRIQSRPVNRQGWHASYLLTAVLLDPITSPSHEMEVNKFPLFWNFTQYCYRTICHISKWYGYLSTQGFGASFSCMITCDNHGNPCLKCVHDKPILHIPQYTSLISHNTLHWNKDMYGFCPNVVHCGIWDWDF